MYDPESSGFLELDQSDEHILESFLNSLPVSDSQDTFIGTSDCFPDAVNSNSHSPSLNEDDLDSILKTLLQDECQTSPGEDAARFQEIPTSEGSPSSTDSSQFMADFSMDNASYLSNCPERVCKVCGKPAGRHYYYNARVCHSCRAFFRRAILSGNYKKFTCRKSNNCDIDSKSWKSCQKCRYSKCVAAGMRSDLVLKEGKAKASKQQVIKPKAKSAVLYKMPTELLSVDDKIYLQGMYQKLNEHHCQVYINYFVQHPQDFEEGLQYISHGKTVSHEAVMRVENFVNFEGGKFFEHVGEVMNLDQEDRAVLLKENFPLAAEFFTAGTMNSRRVGNMLMQLAFSFIVRAAKSSQDMAQLKYMTDRLNITPDRDYETIGYDKFFAGLPHLDQCSLQRHRELVCRMRSWCSDEDDCDDLKTMLGILVILFSTEGLSLKRANAVEALRTKYTRLLHCYLKEKYKSEPVCSNLYQGIFMGLYAKEMIQLNPRKLSHIFIRLIPK